jgi:hypothetical protein
VSLRSILKPDILAHGTPIDDNGRRSLLWSIGSLSYRHLFAAAHFVAYWHKADITIALTNVGFWGKSGS